MQQEKLYLRSVTMEDKKILYEWRNDPICRKNSMKIEGIEYDSHCIWLMNKLNSDECSMFICMKEDEPVGQIRIDCEGDIGKISYCVASNFRGKGYGKRMLALMEHDKRLPEKTTKLYAVVKRDNIASQKCFENLNYSKEFKGGLFYYNKTLQIKE